MIFDVVAEGLCLLVTRLGLGDVDFLRARRLGQRLQIHLSLKAPAQLAVGVQGTQQRRQSHDLQEQQRTVPANLFQRNDGGKKAVGGLEDIQLRGKEKQSGKQQ